MIKDARTTEQIRLDIRSARDGMAANVEGLIAEVHPQAVKTRVVNDAKTFAADTAATAKETIVDERGIRWDNIGTALIVTAGVLATLAVLKGIAGLLRR